MFGALKRLCGAPPSAAMAPPESHLRSHSYRHRSRHLQDFKFEAIK